MLTPPPPRPGPVAGHATGRSRVATLHAVASRQGGVISRPQLLAAGWSSSSIGRAVAAGGLRPLAPGVYQIAGSAWTNRSAQLAALLLVGGNAVLSHGTAAALHGITDAETAPVNICASHSAQMPRGAAGMLRLHRTRCLLEDERAEVDGLPVTSGSRTLLDLAARLGTDQLAELLASAIRVRVTTLHDVRATLEAHPNQLGRGRLRQAVVLLSDDGAASRSDVEVTALSAIIAAGLPRPVVAHRVLGASGRVIAEVDLAFPGLRIAIEIDGYRWHMSPAQKRSDETRQNRLVLAGWLVLRFSASDVRARPAQLVAAVRRAIETRSD